MDTSSLMEQILSNDNLNGACLQVVRNKGAEGVDGMKYTELKEHLAKNGETIKEQLRTRKYKPQPVRRVEIPKPDGGVRNLGVPTVTDRFIQQAIAQVLTPIYEEQFHEHSYGFRPNRCAQQAILTALDMMSDGNDWIVDIDLEKFFDTVNHDKLMTLIGRTIKDGDVIMLEGSSTTFNMVQFLDRFEDLLVVSNSAKVSLSLGNMNIKNISTGGKMSDNTFSFVGQEAINTLKNYNADILFCSSMGLSEDGYFTDDRLCRLVYSIKSKYPELIDKYASAGYDLVVAGHAHGGQFRLPFIGGVYAPGQGFLPKYTAGLYETDDLEMYVGTGIGNSVIPVRIFNPPEILTIILETQK